MKTFQLRTALFGTLLLGTAVATGCVADRPARNGVFDENQYVRKDFLIQGTDANGQAAGNDPGWLMRATVTETSTPNLLGSAIGVWGGLTSEVNLVRFRVTSDKLQMLDQIQLSTPQAPDPTTGKPGPVDTTGTTEAVVNAWPVTNVDLKYQVNLDGEKTNFYQENQELDWSVRQWVKVNFDKNDLSDLAPLGQITNDLLGKCGDMVDASATILPNSFVTDSGDPSTISDDYMEFTIQVTVPMTMSADVSSSGTADTTCLTAYGPMLARAIEVNRSTVTLNLKYSFKRAAPVSELTYKPLVLDEKDPIHTKYGPILHTVFNRDNQTQLLAATQYVERFDPTKPIVWYFDKNFPEYYKPIFLGTKGNPGIMKGTNDVLEKSGAAARVSFLNYNDAKSYGDGQGPDREYGDIRYNFLRWVSDQDMQDSFAGVTMEGLDPRTGEEIAETIEFNDFAVKDYYVQRIDAFLATVGASGGLQSGQWPTGACKTNQQLVNSAVVNNHNASSTLFTKMQSYLGLHGPDPKNDHLGPQDFVANDTEDADFLHAYFALIPYELFADPDANLFVTREGGAGVYGPANLLAALQGEGQFRDLAAKINSGWEPFSTIDGADGTYNAAAFANEMRAATQAHQQLNYMQSFIYRGVHKDSPGSFSLEAVMEQDAQRCINGQLESQDSWVQHILDTYWQQVFWHEFGHAMGLEHNFMGNVDQPNFTTARDASGKPLTDTSGHTLYNMYSSSVMEYNAEPARLFWTQGWGNYDKGSIAWIYANNAKQPDNTTKDGQATANKSRSGLVPGPAGQEGSGAYPWKDPMGFCASGDPDCTAGAERAFLFCNELYTKYSPICRAGDLGTTPSQIIANDIDMYEWQYQWRNFRDYRKVWDEAAYANQVAGFVVDTRRFLSQWAFDWSPGEIAATLYRIGITPPPNAPSAVDYYSQLTYKFLVEMSKANQMVGAFHEAIIQQANGERPFATIYDKYYGDVTQQGIILDKYFAMQEFVGLWQSDNYDQNQAGAYISSWGDYDFDMSYTSVAETAISSMIGSQYAAYPYFIPTAVALFAQDTHNPSFLSNGNSGPGSGGSRIEAKDWIGGWTFTDESFLINWFRTLSVNACTVQGNQAACAGGCDKFETCTYDPTDPAQASQDPLTRAFTGPDGLTYVYARIPSRNQWVLARQDRNIVMYKLLTQYNTDIFGTQDDGTQGAYSLYEYPIKYTIDAYNAYESGGGTTGGSSSSSTSSGM